MNLSDALVTIALLIPGYVGTWAMAFVLGSRKREWAQTLLYSLIFTSLIYALLLFLTATVRRWWPHALQGLVDNLAFIDQLGSENKSQKLTFGIAVRLGLPAIIVGLLLGTTFGKIRRSVWFNKLLSRFFQKTQYNDLWVDFYSRMENAAIVVVLKNGNAFVGPLRLYPDAATDTGRGVIVVDPIYLVKPFESATPEAKSMYGELLIPQEEIAMMLDVRHPDVIALRDSRRSR